MRNRLITTLLIAATVAFAFACGGGDGGPKKLSESDAATLARAVAIQASDLGADYNRDAEQTQTNEQAATARPDTDNAREQYKDWQRVLAYNVQYAAPPTSDLLFNNKTARAMNTIEVFNSEDGASKALEFLRTLPEAIVEDMLEAGSGSGTTLSETKVEKGLDFVPKGDESFAWRVTGKATLPGDFVIRYVADVVFVREGRVNANVTTVAVGQPPMRDELEGLVDLFIQRVQAQDAG
jgi:hypothetical protein